MKTIIIILAIVASSPYLQAGSAQAAGAQQGQSSPAAGSSPSSSAPQSAPSTSTVANHAQAVPVNDLLRKIYNSAYRVSDLLGLLQPDKWKASDAERKSVDATTEMLRADLKTLEDTRSQFSSQVQNLALGAALDTAMRPVLLNVDAVARWVSQYESPAQASLYTQAHDQLADLQRSLEADLDSLRASQTKPPASEAAGPAPETEKISASAPPPPATTAIEAGYMTPEQVKSLLHRIYVATFRLNDLLTVVQPGPWQVPEPVRDNFNLSVAKLHADLKKLEASRSEFSEQTDNAYAGYQTLEAMPSVISDLRTVDGDIAQFEGNTTVRLFDQPAQWLDESQQALKAYLDFVLRNRNQVIHTYEANLATCQNTLNYSMRSQTMPARPMEPVRFVRPLQSAKIRRKEAEEAARRAEEGSGTSGSETAAKQGGTGKSEEVAAGASEAKAPNSTAAPAKSTKKRKSRHSRKKTTEASR